MYIHFKPKNSYQPAIEKFEANTKSLVRDDIYKENHDLNYMKNRINLKLPLADNVATQKIAPINNPSIV